MHKLTFTVCPQGIEETRQVIDAFLEALVVTNELYFRRLPKGPCCPECAGVRYRPPSAEDAATPDQTFESAERMIVKGEAACGPIAAMVAAHKRVFEGINAKAIAQPTSSSELKFHAVVQLPNGDIIDPTTDLPRALSVGARPQPFPSCGCAGGL